VNDANRYLKFTKLQQRTCARFNASFVACPLGSKVGFARGTSIRRPPLNGLRHPPTESTCGWYLWSGENLSDAPDFFEPMHVEHLARLCPEALPYLGLPPGYRFLLAPNYEDIWFDPDLLDV
jgi:hypothetical protein